MTVVSDDFRMRPAGSPRNNITQQSDASIVALVAQSAAAQNVGTRGDADECSTLNREAQIGHSRPGWREKISSDGRQI